MRVIFRGAAVSAVWCVAMQTAAAQSQAASTIPVRSLTTAASSDSGVFRSAAQVRPLSKGSVIVNDRSRRRLVMLDSTLKNVKVLADTAVGAPNRYGEQVTGLLPFTGDSSIFVDNQSQSLIVVDPYGMFGRVMAPPKASDLFLMTGFSSGFDSKGRPIYRVPRRNPTAGPGRSVAPDGAGRPVMGSQPDSAAIVRADFDTRQVDTIMMIKIPVQKTVTVSPQPGVTMQALAVNPLPQTDEWTLLPDGTIAVVRATDYHIDWLSPDGKLTSTPKMPFDWKPITQDEKEQLIDSLKQAAAKREAEAAAKAAQGGEQGAAGSVAVGDRVVLRTERLVSSGAVRIPFTTVEPSDLPDFFPPIRAGQVRADADGHVWILPSTSTLSQGTVLGSANAQSSSLVYDVVGRDGLIKERVKLPPGRLIAGFAPGGVVYMTYAPVPGVVFVERARIQRGNASAQ